MQPARRRGQAGNDRVGDPRPEGERPGVRVLGGSVPGRSRRAPGPPRGVRRPEGPLPGRPEGRRRDGRPADRLGRGGAGSARPDVPGRPPAGPHHPGRVPAVQRPAPGRPGGRRDDHRPGPRLLQRPERQNPAPVGHPVQDVHARPGGGRRPLPGLPGDGRVPPQRPGPAGRAGTHVDRVPAGVIPTRRRVPGPAAGVAGRPRRPAPGRRRPDRATGRWAGDDGVQGFPVRADRGPGPGRLPGGPNRRPGVGVAGRGRVLEGGPVLVELHGRLSTPGGAQGGPGHPARSRPGPGPRSPVAGPARLAGGREIRRGGPGERPPPGPAR